MTSNLELTTEDWQNDILIMGEQCDCCGHTKALLSPQESVIYSHLIAGWTVKRISEKLFLSPKSVSTYKYRIYTKLCLDGENGDRERNIAMLIHYMRERSIVVKALARDGKENISPEFLAGFVHACEEFTTPDIRLITGKVGLITERRPMPDLPNVRGLKSI